MAAKLSTSPIAHVSYFLFRISVPTTRKPQYYPQILLIPPLSLPRRDLSSSIPRRPLKVARVCFEDFFENVNHIFIRSLECRNERPCLLENGRHVQLLCLVARAFDPEAAYLRDHVLIVELPR
jgi:hypothetical protein